MPFLPQRPEDKPKYSDTCTHPEHNPPTMIVLEPGIHRYQCPACKYITVIRVLPKYSLEEDNKAWNL